MRIKTQCIETNSSRGLREEFCQQQNRNYCRLLPYPSIPYCPPGFGKVKTTTQHPSASGLSFPVIFDSQIKLRSGFEKWRKLYWLQMEELKGKWCKNDPGREMKRHSWKISWIGVFCADNYWDTKKMKIIFWEIYNCKEKM